jgi:hypothetical protein
MRFFTLLSICALVALAPSPATAQNMELAVEPITLAANQAEVYWDFQAPHWVQSYAVVCDGGTGIPTLQIGIKDCCMPGDHWDAKAHFYDKKPVNTSVCGGGGTGTYRTVVGGSGGWPLRSIVSARYAHGINIFGAGAYMRFTCYPVGSLIEVTDLGQAPDR